MKVYYEAEIVAVDAVKAIARIEATGQQIAFSHDAFNAVPPDLRQPGAKGFISFPKAPPVFSARQELEAAA